MKESLTRFVFLAVCVVTFGGHIAVAASQPKVTICHFPPGNPANVQVITVGAPAVAAHVSNHNDAVCPVGDSNCCFGGSDPSTCTNFASDVNNCGGCGVVCSTGQVCTSGTCTTVCGEGETSCDGVCVNENTDPNNCGGCGTVCSTGQACASGVCTTNPSPECMGQTCDTFTTCNPSACDGQGVCFSTAEGGGFCGTAVPCAGLAPCATSTDCPSGGICQVNTCCGAAGVCVPASSLCQ